MATELHRLDVVKGSGTSVRCRLLQVGEEVRVDIRVHSQDVPLSGFTLAPHQLPALISALKHTHQMAESFGLLHEDAA